ncbi:hypothetical protein [Bacillus marinisedimentorum]|uniref:hypothetical protein n=1 Tax=Bacillus marinisedimentorum TaxID=1821260 RepID=UPI0007E03996|nr:hypothetical protein [Bacillus marinisedimentorum]
MAEIRLVGEGGQLTFGADLVCLVTGLRGKWPGFGGKLAPNGVKHRTFRVKCTLRREIRLFWRITPGLALENWIGWRETELEWREC